MKLKAIVLVVKENEVIIGELNILLSNYQTYYQNLRGLHWNIRGRLLSILLEIERAILSKANENNDEGTNSMMSDFIFKQEETIWMMMAWLEEKV